MTLSLEERIAKPRRIRDESIPSSSRLASLPPSDVLNVTHIPRQCGLLSDEELSITEDFTAVQLVEMMASENFTAEQVITAFLKRAGIAHQLTNCATEFMSDEATARAKELDAHLASTGKTVGHLHGLPVSVKEHLGFKGRICHAGWAAWTDNIPKEDALLLQILYKAGAVFYVRTPQPQSIMHLECSSNIYGTTVNGYNRSLTSGGSSGGEGALGGLNGTVLSIGTDIGGSVRSPAANNGLYALRPTTFRVPKLGLVGVQAAREGILGVIGPMSRGREDLSLFMKTVVGAEPWWIEPSINPIPWRPVSLSLSDLTVAIMPEDGVVHPHPPVQRAIRETRAKLEKAGVAVIEWEPFQTQLHWDIVSALYYCNDAQEERDLMKQGNEPVLPLTEWIMSQPGHKLHKWGDDMNNLIKARDKFRIDYAQLWNERQKQHGRKIDVILMPAGPSAAPILGTAKWWGYTSIWNLLDYPAAVFPVTTVQATDAAERDYVPKGTLDSENHALYTSYEAYKDAPIGLQVIGRRYEDERVLECLRLIEQAMGRP